MAHAAIAPPAPAYGRWAIAGAARVAAGAASVAQVGKGCRVVEDKLPKAEICRRMPRSLVRV